jgi:tripeptide aminopeptidase
MNTRHELLTRFFRYVAIESQSDGRVRTLPSTAGQHALAALLAAEMRDLGLDDVVVDENAIVTAIKRGNRPSSPTVGFIAHLDTADVGLSPAISPQVLRFDGADLCLNQERGIWFRAADHPEAMAWRGQDIIFSDGTSVLGADNKAAIAIIMTLLSQLRSCAAHGDICVAFVPDEEIGLRGAKALVLSRFPCDFAYTIDCCELGEVVVENFNAALGEITFIGVSAHPMSAKGVMVNPLLMALDFVAEFDRGETPECTAGKEGYFWFSELTANDGKAHLTVMIRDFDKIAFERRKRRIGEVAELVRQRYPRGRVEFEVSDTYGNISDSLGGDRRPIDLLLAALKELEITPKLIPMRGGTDGAALSARGLPTPNFFTGAYNFHSRFEFLPVAAFEKSFETALAICELAAKEIRGNSSGV